MRSRPVAAPRRQRPVSIAVTGITSEIKNGTVEAKKPENKPPLPKTRKSSLVKSQEKIIKKKSLSSPTEGSPKAIVSPTSAPICTIENSNIMTTQNSVDKEKIIKDNMDVKSKQSNVNEKESVDESSLVTKEAEIEDNTAQVAQ